ncbi:MAG: hypothetical protein Q4G08_07445 [Capnocytophaga sp.]|nr:hypothetical protein [Capnocytophaga sp.]
MTRRERLHNRNERVRSLFKTLCVKNPKWRTDAVIDEVATRVFLAPRTVEAIIKGEGIYANTPENENNQLKLFDF